MLREIKERGYTGSYTIVKDFIRQVKGAKPKPAFVRFETPPGEQAQVDWSEFGWLECNGKRMKLWCFSMVLGYSRTLYVLEHSEMRKSSKDCYISFDGNRYSVPYQYSCRDLSVKLKGDDLHIYYGDVMVASHRLNYQKGQMITDQKHFAGIPRPAYPSGVRAIREVFLSHFPHSNPFLDGLVKTKYGNARYHMLQILSLLEDHPQSLVESAIDRALSYSAFGYSFIRNICRQGGISPLPKEERALSCYSELEG